MALIVIFTITSNPLIDHYISRLILLVDVIVLQMARGEDLEDKEDSEYMEETQRRYLENGRFKMLLVLGERLNH